MLTPAAIHQAALLADRPARHASLALDLAFGVAFLVPFGVMLWLVIRQRRHAAKRRRASAFNQRTLEYHERMNAAQGLYSSRGSCGLEMLAALAFCLVWSALIIGLLACSDAADLVTLFRP
jgi:hypothetical protein